MYELKGVPQPPKRTRGGAFRASRKRAGTRYVRKLAGRAAGASSVRAPRGGRGRGRVGGGSSLIAKLFRKVIAKAGLRRPTLRSLFRKKSVGDGRNHGVTGVKKRNGRTGLAGR